MGVKIKQLLTESSASCFLGSVMWETLGCFAKCDIPTWYADNSCTEELGSSIRGNMYKVKTNTDDGGSCFPNEEQDITHFNTITE